jgi:hypothetical protein
MIIEDERDMPKNFRYISSGDLVEPTHDGDRIQAFLEAHARIENKEVHDQLQVCNMILLSITGLSMVLPSCV